MWLWTPKKVSKHSYQLGAVIVGAFVHISHIDTIRVWSFDEPPPGDEMEDYLKYYPYHAPMYLASYLQQVRSLEIIPSVSRYDRKLYNKHYPEVVGHSLSLRLTWIWSNINAYSPKSRRSFRSNVAGRMTSRRLSGRLIQRSLGSGLTSNDPDHETDNDDELGPEVLRNGGDHEDFYLRHWVWSLTLDGHGNTRVSQDGFRMKNRSWRWIPSQEGGWIFAWTLGVVFGSSFHTHRDKLHQLSQ